MNYFKNFSITFVLLFIFAFPFVTKAQTIDDILRQLLILRNQLAELQSGGSVTTSGPNCIGTASILRQGDTDIITNGAVSRLQRYLRDQGYFTYPEITGYYGSITTDAVQRYQVAKGIVSFGEQNQGEYGNVGNRTLAFMNANCRNSNSDSDSDNYSGDVDIGVDLNDDTFRPGETIIISGEIENDTSRTLSGPVSYCSGLDVKVNKNIDGYFTFVSPCYLYSNTTTVKPGETKRYEARLVLNNTADEGEYKLRVTFPGGYSEEIEFEVESDDNDDNSNGNGDIVTNIRLNKTTFAPGETINVVATITNNTYETIRDNVGTCYSIIMDVDGLENEHICNNPLGYLDDTVGARTSKSYVGYFTIPDDATTGDYDMEVTFPGRYKETVEFEVED